MLLPLQYWDIQCHCLLHAYLAQQAIKTIYFTNLKGWRSSRNHSKTTYRIDRWRFIRLFAPKMLWRHAAYSISYLKEDVQLHTYWYIVPKVIFVVLNTEHHGYAPQIPAFSSNFMRIVVLVPVTSGSQSKGTMVSMHEWVLVEHGKGHHCITYFIFGPFWEWKWVWSL